MLDSVKFNSTGETIQGGESKENVNFLALNTWMSDPNFDASKIQREVKSARVEKLKAKVLVGARAMILERAVRDYAKTAQDARQFLIDQKNAKIENMKQGEYKDTFMARALARMGAPDSVPADWDPEEMVEDPVKKMEWRSQECNKKYDGIEKGYKRVTLAVYDLDSIVSVKHVGNSLVEIITQSGPKQCYYSPKEEGYKAADLGKVHTRGPKKGEKKDESEEIEDFTGGSKKVMFQFVHGKKKGSAEAEEFVRYLNNEKGFGLIRKEIQKEDAAEKRFMKRQRLDPFGNFMGNYQW